MFYYFKENFSIYFLNFFKKLSINFINFINFFSLLKHVYFGRDIIFDVNKFFYRLQYLVFKLEFGVYFSNFSTFFFESKIKFSFKKKFYLNSKKVGLKVLRSVRSFLVMGKEKKFKCNKFYVYSGLFFFLKPFEECVTIDKFSIFIKNLKSNKLFSKSLLK